MLRVRVPFLWTLLLIVWLTACVPESMVQEAVSATESAWTPVPTQTALPTYRPLPTYTAYPTLTPYPTLTLRPTYTPFPTATDLPEPTATVEKEIIFEESFDREITCFETGSSNAGSISVQEEALHLNVTSATEPVWTLCEAEYFSDFVLEVDAVRVGGASVNSYGVLFGGQHDMALAFVITTDGLFGLSLVDLANMEEGVYPLIATFSPTMAVKGGTRTNHLRVVAAHNRLEVYANDTMLGSVLDNGLHSGKIGFMAFTFEGDGVQVAFDNLRVTEP